jgi:hypothetical protein
MKRILTLTIAAMLMLSGFAFAYDMKVMEAKDDFAESYLDFNLPEALEPSMEYEFTLTVYNAATPPAQGKSDWIWKVELSMPSQDYVFDEGQLTAPTPLHPTTTDYWDAGFNPSSSMITWEVYGIVATKENPIGDIRDGESLEFGFVATTDSLPTDGFYYSLWGDEGIVVSDTAYIEGDDDDDFGDDDDDDDAAPGDDDDDDSSSGCCG